MLDRVGKKGNPPTLLLEMKTGATPMENRREVPQTTKNRVATLS